MFRIDSEEESDRNALPVYMRVEKMYVCKVYVKGEYKETFKDYCISQTKVWLMAKKYECKLEDVQIDCLRM